MRPIVKILTGVTAAAALAAVVIFVVLPMLHPKPLDISVDRTQYPVKGLDVSHHNGNIDFDKVVNDSVNFVIIKATDGVGDTDPKLTANYNNAHRAGLDVGVYHFFRYHRDGHAQAKYFMQVIDTLRIDLPVAIDLEDSDNESGHESFIAQRLRNMVDDLKAAGYDVMIYANRDQYNAYIDGRFDDVSIWMASSYAPKPGERRDIWQHSHKGSVNGIDGPVDINTFNGSAAEYRRWLRNPRQ